MYRSMFLCVNQVTQLVLIRVVKLVNIRKKRFSHDYVFILKNLDTHPLFTDFCMHFLPKLQRHCQSGSLTNATNRDNANSWYSYFWDVSETLLNIFLASCQKGWKTY